MQKNAFLMWGTSPSLMKANKNEADLLGRSYSGSLLAERLSGAAHIFSSVRLGFKARLDSYKLYNIEEVT